MNKLIACCGINCETCEARLATIKNDDKMRVEVAKKWCEMNHTDQITPESINCVKVAAIWMTLMVAIAIAIIRIYFITSRTNSPLPRHCSPRWHQPFCTSSCQDSRHKFRSLWRLHIYAPHTCGYRSRTSGLPRDILHN